VGGSSAGGSGKPPPKDTKKTQKDAEMKRKAFSKKSSTNHKNADAHDKVNGSSNKEEFRDSTSIPGSTYRPISRFSFIAKYIL
jgi:hypothetical protein